MNIPKSLLPVLMVVGGFIYAGNDKYFTQEHIPALNRDLAAAKALFKALEEHCAECQEGSAEVQEECTPVNKYQYKLGYLQGYYDRYRDAQETAKKARSVLPEEYKKAKAQRKNFKAMVLDTFKQTNSLPEEFK